MPSVDFQRMRVLGLATMALGYAHAIIAATTVVRLPDLDVPGLGASSYADAFLRGGALLWLVGVARAIQKGWNAHKASANKPEVTS